MISTSVIIPSIKFSDSSHKIYLHLSCGVTICVGPWKSSKGIKDLVHHVFRPLCLDTVGIEFNLSNPRVYTLVCSFFLVGLAFTKGTIPQGNGFFDSLGKFLTSTNGVIVIALASTFGVYILASVLYLDPWHMLHSFPQYLLMVTSYINILNVYAFCNWHDVSWGTKGADKADSLPSAHTTKKSDTEGGASAEVLEYELPQADIDLKFEKVVKRALAPYKEPEKSKEKSLDDAYKAFRTNLIAVWIFSYSPVVEYH
jgi:chitin synthase